VRRPIAVAIVVCAVVLAPAPARADDGGWLDWLFRMDPRFTGFATEFHAYCGDADGKAIKNCEEFFGLRHLFGEPLPENERLHFAELRHELNVRIAYYHTVGDLYDADKGDSAHAIKLMLFYGYHPNSHLLVSVGGGVLPFFGADTKETRWSGVFTPLSVRYFPAASGGHVVPSSFFVQMEGSYITRIPTPDLFVNYPSPPASTAIGEWNTSIGFGVDFRRRR